MKSADYTHDFSAFCLCPPELWLPWLVFLPVLGRLRHPFSQTDGGCVWARCGGSGDVGRADFGCFSGAARKTDQVYTQHYMQGMWIEDLIVL